MLGALLVAIVGLRVEVLKLGSGVGAQVQQATLLESDNSVLRSQISALSDNHRIITLAAGYGMYMPAPLDVHLVSSAAGTHVGAAARNISAPSRATFLSGLASEQQDSGQGAQTASSTTTSTSGATTDSTVNTASGGTVGGITDTAVAPTTSDTTNATTSDATTSNLDTSPSTADATNSAPTDATSSSTTAGGGGDVSSGLPDATAPPNTSPTTDSTDSTTASTTGGTGLAG